MSIIYRQKALCSIMNSKGTWFPDGLGIESFSGDSDSAPLLWGYVSVWVGLQVVGEGVVVMAYVCGEI
jgi:hypothetical protein